MTRLMSRQELQNLRSVCQKALSLETKKILVCGGTGCVAGGSLDIYDKLKDSTDCTFITYEDDMHGFHQDQDPAVIREWLETH